MNKSTSSYFGSFTIGFVRQLCHTLETWSCSPHKQLRALCAKMVDAHQWRNRPSKNDLKVDSRSFIHCIREIEIHYRPRDTHLDAVSDARVRKHS